MGYYPQVEELLEGSDDDRLLEVHRSLRSILSHVFLALFMVLVIILLFLIFQDVRVRWLGILPALVILEIFRKRHDDLYILGRRNITHHSGRFSLSMQIPNLKYLHIRSIKVKQGVVGRLFDFGDISIGTAAQESDELFITGIRDPLGLAMLLEELRSHSKRTSSLGQSDFEDELSHEND
ncbi:MAG: PH domain-containing protein [Bdellovibrionales bacterium]|nr:PH domain-containing protein [Bdellovibrionales bacterium]